MPNYTLLKSTDLIQLQEDAPVALCTVRIFRNNTDNLIFANFIFQVLSDLPISAMMVSFSCADAWGNSLTEEEFQYLDLSTVKGSSFGEDIPVPLSDPNTRRISVRITKILYTDDRVDNCNGELMRFDPPVPLAQHLGNDALAAEYVRQTTPAARFVPKMLGNCWLCSCGIINNSSDSCVYCGSTLGALNQILNPKLLKNSLASIQETQEKAAADQLERDKQAAEQAQIKFTAISAKKRRVKRTIAAIVASAVAVTMLCCILFFWILPSIKYDRACKALENKEFDSAYSMFHELGSFRNSREMSLNCIYEEGLYLMGDGRYDEAITEFYKISSFKDSKEKIVEAKCCQVLSMLENGQIEQAKELLRSFEQISDFPSNLTTAGKNVILQISFILIEHCEFDTAYSALKWIPNHEGTPEAIDLCLNSWLDDILRDQPSMKSVNSAQCFIDTVPFDDDTKTLLFTRIHEYILKYPGVNEWVNHTIRGELVCLLLDSLPAEYEKAGKLSLFISNVSRIHSGDTFICQHRELIEDLFEYPLVKNYLNSYLDVWLDGYWYCSSTYFWDIDNGRFNLPVIGKSDPSARYSFSFARYFSTTFYTEFTVEWLFEVTLMSPTVIQITIYSDNSTYTLVRR